MVKKRIVTFLVALAAVVLVGWGVLHVAITPVNPAQEPPSGHVDAGCWACHFVLSSAEIIAE